MRKLIHLRGTHGAGKTSTARDFLSQLDYEIRYISIGGKDYAYCIDPKKNYVVTGRYDQRDCGGLDGVIKSAKLMREYLYKIMKHVKPDVIVFEAVMYGATFKFGYELNTICSQLGFKYIGILLNPELQKVVDNVYNRNGGRPVKIKNTTDKYFASLTAAQKLKEAGVSCFVEDSSRYKLDELHRIVEKYIND